VYLVRHAEPAFPAEPRRFLGRSDPPLSALGVEQARSLAEELRAVPFDSVYSSDLQRCVQTAGIVAAAVCRPPGREALQIHLDPRLREIDCGLWEGLTREEALTRYPEEYAQRERDVAGYPFPGGESFEDLRARVVPALQDIIKAGGSHILVVSHLGVMRVLLCESRGLPLEQLFSIRLEHASLVVLKASRSTDGSRLSEVAGESAR
jgi:alpha-ribazole phosphatase